MRIAYATKTDEGVALGDPTGLHVNLGPGAVEYRRGSEEVLHHVSWAQLRDLAVNAPSSPWRRPGVMAMLIGATAEAVGMGWTPTTAPVTVIITHTDAGAAHAVDLACDGYIGRGYRRPHLQVLDDGTHVLLTHPAAREVLNRPAQVLVDLEAASGLPAAEARARLAQAWGTTCHCG